jgi:para-nitrobenzyl esterase
MVWLHGGGFAVARRPAREVASLLSGRADLVVVAPNHRLSAFGYLYLEADGRPFLTPNLGMLNIVAALEWVRDNIEAFGGDSWRPLFLSRSASNLVISKPQVQQAAFENAIP